MIEGLKVCLPAKDLRDLCLAAARYHAERATAYRAQVDSLKAAHVEGMDDTNGNPIETLTERMEAHEEAETEMAFLAQYVREGEEYLLDRSEVAELGVAGRYRPTRGRRAW